jgi:glycine betaine/proline transport system substrate-binding protein
MSRLRVRRALLGLAALAATALTPMTSYAVESNDPIKIALFDWTSVNLNAKILGGILEKLGYTVEYPTADYLSSLTTGLTNGDLTVGVEFWDTTAGEAMKASDATGQTEKLGMLGPKAKEEWWYPAYMKEKCPGLPNWEALKDPRHARRPSPRRKPRPRAAISAAPSPGAASMTSASRRWTCPSTVDPCRHRRRALRRARNRLPAPGAHPPVDLRAALGAGQVRGRVGRSSRPIRPNATTDPATWGVQPRCQAYDCGKPHRPDLERVGWAGVKDKWPGAYKAAIKAYHIDTAELNKLSGQVDLEGKSLDEVAASWIAANEATSEGLGAVMECRRRTYRRPRSPEFPGSRASRGRRWPRRA